MSAIFGVYHLKDKPVSSQLLGEMSDILSHRGKDGIGVWSDEAIGLGHRMLWTTPESVAEQLPKNIHNGSLAITADARIDNRDELFKRLNLSRNLAVKNLSDSELILFAYEKWGEKCTEKLIGDFAFAIWDKRNRSLFCARDHFGVKSLYYYYSEKVFVFATEIKALLCVEEIPRLVNEAKISDYLEGNCDDVSSTFYKDIYKLPVSCQMVVNRSGKSIKKYWSLNAENELRLSSNEEYAENFREIFTEAVRCRMRSDFTVGSMLSGGLDSTSIACVARQIMTDAGKGDLPTFSAIFDNIKQSDEQPFINAALSQGGLNPSFLHADRISPLTDLEQISWHQDQVLDSFNLYLNWGIYKLAQKRGVRVLLDGFDGDTTVSHGVVHLDELAIKRNWVTLAKELKGYGRHIEQSPYKLMWNYFNYYQVKPAVAASPLLKFAQRKGRAIMRRASRQPSPASPKFIFDELLNHEFVNRVDLVSRRQNSRALRGKHPKVEKEDHLRKLNWGIMEQTLDVLDKSASAFGIELRFPFWDKRLVDFCLSIPAEQKIQRGWTRFVLRNSMTDILPKAIQWRDGKANMGYAFRHNFLNFSKERVEEVVKNKTGKINQYINLDVLRQSYSFFETGIIPTDEELISSFKITALALWLERADLSS